MSEALPVAEDRFPQSRGFFAYQNGVMEGHIIYACAFINIRLEKNKCMDVYVFLYICIHWDSKKEAQGEREMAR